LEAFFLDGKAGRLCCVYHPPQGVDLKPASARRAMLLIPPFAEELNMSRHTFARLARRLAKSGIGVLLVDLYGTGDSEGDFHDARWQIWRDDVLAGISWLIARGHDSVDLLGLRLGGVLAMDAAKLGSAQIDRIVLWNPVTSGRNHVNQFLRLRTLGGISGDEMARETTKELRALLTGGQMIDVLGYRFSPPLAKDLDTLNLAEFGAACTANVDWFEVTGENANGFSPGSSRILDVWLEKGVRVAAHPVLDKPFWALQGIEPHWGDGLITATVGALS
jgi:exosortase A-associated hydrolase 2